MIAIQCWVELDIAGNDLSQPNPQFIKTKEDCDENQEGVGVGDSRPPMGGGGRSRTGRRGSKGGRRSRGRRKRPRPHLRHANNFAQNLEAEKNGDTSPDSAAEPSDSGPEQEGEPQQTPTADTEQEDSSEPSVDTPQEQDSTQSQDTDQNQGPDSSQELDPDQDQSGGEPPVDEDGLSTTSKSMIEQTQKPRLKMIKSKKENGKEKVERKPMETNESSDIIDMEPKTSIKVCL